MESELERFMSDHLDVTYTEVERLPSGGSKLKEKVFMNTPLDWWRQRGCKEYRTLARMAWDLFSIPAQSSECERVFSTSRKMITDERFRLQADTIEADQCLKSWLKQHLVDEAATWQTFSVLAYEEAAQRLEDETSVLC